MDLSQPLASITVEFGDGVLECMGHMSAPEAEAVSADDRATVEHAALIYIEVVENGWITYAGDKMRLPSGRYLVDDTGLYRRYDFEPATDT